MVEEIASKLALEANPTDAQKAFLDAYRAENNSREALAQRDAQIRDLTGPRESWLFQLAFPSRVKERRDHYAGASCRRVRVLVASVQSNPCRAAYTLGLAFWS